MRIFVKKMGFILSMVVGFSAFVVVSGCSGKDDSKDGKNKPKGGEKMIVGDLSASVSGRWMGTGSISGGFGEADCGSAQVQLMVSGNELTYSNWVYRCGDVTVTHGDTGVYDIDGSIIYTKGHQRVGQIVNNRIEVLMSSGGSTMAVKVSFYQDSSMEVDERWDSKDGSFQFNGLLYRQ
ncbi:MAG: hypothetical protein COT73_04035 [Bdellovibrio sp. CG10_big_fil_rev_8_21_14_0_10_47_8]|nr:MAG: hypothetical protein COT73_04035 [Bdellovibrio sp. CG10_big_fil_rev_8_21_14_0_10_47_8]